ncbi:Sir2 family NAD-dependent protein deacetylase [Nocardioides sp.]|uniref:Sir2 family NAD-dependent protein deacetylase n=1 Tax=Nocardioides sp. TaxID=35761 RepID=UPI002D7FC4AA|nr:Sir2 family NAD-dependent protein deacetylase [Nocardioides sp.]HET8959168.1 Sir2 family NAD-dependent protein deacetylase [Nocardioides sp.]
MTTPLVERREVSVEEALDLLVGRPLVVLTGAGLSTDSGIPDYRGPGSPSRMPMTIAEFRSGPAAQRRYWARSHLGWGRMRGAAPNAGHRALAALDPELLITQNVDGLHEQAGSRRLVALHGRISQVVCLGCRTTSPRAALQARLAELNPGFADQHAGAQVRPDGDVELDDTSTFRVPGCRDCGGVLKPDVVFFGENVPAERVERCYAAVDDLATTGGALLVAGSSLTVMSGFRFVRRAARAGTPVVIVNRGETRGDELATYKLDVGCSEFLTSLAEV